MKFARILDEAGNEGDPTGEVVFVYDVTKPTAAVTTNYNGQDVSCNGASDGCIAASWRMTP